MKDFDLNKKSGLISIFSLSRIKESKYLLSMKKKEKLSNKQNSTMKVAVKE